MSAPTLHHAWLESVAGEPVQIVGVCNLGRSPSSQFVLKDRKASRRHAFIQLQGAGEYWLVDFGSTNGTVVNGRRVVQPTLLRDGDQIAIGGESLTFRKNDPSPGGPEGHETGMATTADIQSIKCWLLLVDIEGSIKLSSRCAPDQWPLVLGRWFSSCKETIEASQGQINKVLGDGLFAYWHDAPATVENIRRAVGRLCQEQMLSQPPFRWVLHYGLVSVGGSMSLGEASLLGRDVNFTFRMERIAAQAGAGRLLSLAAYQQLGLTDGRDVGPFEVNGFSGAHMFRTF